MRNNVMQAYKLVAKRTYISPQGREVLYHVSYTYSQCPEFALSPSHIYEINKTTTRKNPRLFGPLACFVDIESVARFLTPYILHDVTEVTPAGHIFERCVGELKIFHCNIVPSKLKRLWRPISEFHFAKHYYNPRDVPGTILCNAVTPIRDATWDLIEFLRGPECRLIKDNWLTGPRQIPWSSFQSQKD